MSLNLAQDAIIVLTLVVLEAVLSFDNAAILAVMARRLPVGEGRNRALTRGLLIAYALRVMAILGAVYLIEMPVFLTLGGLYLVFLFVRHFWRRLQHRRSEHLPAVQLAKGMFGLSPLATVVIQIGFIDLAFALDQVVAAVAFTQDLLTDDKTTARILIIIAATIGLVFLRLAAPVLSKLMDWLPILEDIALVAVGFVGAVLVLENPYPLQHGIAVDDRVKLGVTLALFLVPIVVKLLFGIPRSSHSHAKDERALEAAQARIDTPDKPRRVKKHS
ncbi:MAG: TerC family protein [Thermoplasmatota archaeon]